MSIKSVTLKRNLNNILIETGTFLGETTRKSIELGYKKVYTIELQERLYESSKKNLKDLIDADKVEIIKGDSALVLENIMKKIDEPITILLDAHIDLGNYVPNVSPTDYPPDNPVDWCPLYKELEVIKNHHIKNHTIMIDDVRIIGVDGWGESLVLEKIKEQLLSINSDYKISFEEGENPEDVLVVKVG
jgi:hypothetical protein